MSRHMAFALSLAVGQVACGSARPAARVEPGPTAEITAETSAAAEPRPAVSPAPSSDTPRGRETIRAVVRESALPGVRACYEAQLGTDPTLRGRVLTSFIIEATGSVRASPEISSALEPGGAAADAVVACVRQIVEGLRFPPDPTGQLVGINYPFVLDSYDCEPSCSDAIGARVVSALETMIPATVACLREVLTTFPEVTGTMNLAVALDASGRATSVTVAPDSLAPPGEGAERARDCARTVFATLTLGAPIETPLVMMTTVAMPPAP